MDKKKQTITHAPNDPDTQEKMVRVNEGIEKTRHNRYRRYLTRRLIRLSAFVFFFFGLVFFLHDFLVRHQYQDKMVELGNLITVYQRDNGRLPSVEVFLGMAPGGRNIRLDQIEYSAEEILPDSPALTLLAYTPLCPQWILPEKYVIITLNGQSRWVNGTELKELVDQRQQAYQQSESKIRQGQSPAP